MIRRAFRLVAANAAVLAGLLLAGEALVRVAAPGVVPAGADEGLFEYRPFADGTGADGTGVDGSGAAWQLRPGASGEAYGAPVAVATDGTWAYAAERDTTGPTVLLVGDSVTMGLGVAPDATFAGRLAALPGVRVANPSVLGWAAADYRRAVEARLATGDSLAQVVLVWCLNDLYPEGQPTPIAAAEAQAAEAPTATFGQRAFQAVKRGGTGPLAWLNRHSRLYRWARTVPTDAAGRTYAFDRALYTDPAYQGDRDRAFGAITAIRDTLRARRIPLTVVVAPEAPQFPASDFVPQDTVRQRLARLGVRALDLTPALDGGDFLTGDGTHLSPSGHAAVARALRPLVESAPRERP